MHNGNGFLDEIAVIFGEPRVEYSCLKQHALHIWTHAGSFTIFTMAYKLYRLLTILYSGCVWARCIYIQFKFYISHKCCSVLCNESIHVTCCSLLSNRCCTSGNLCHNNPYPKISKSFSVSRIFNINVFQKFLLFFFPKI